MSSDVRELLLSKSAKDMTPEELHQVRTQLMQDADLLRLVKLRQLRRINAAQKEPVAFFEYVMREETTRQPIKVAPHQRVILSFVMAHPFCVLMLPVGHSKTFTMGGLALFLMGQDPTLRGAIVSATQTQAMKPLAMVRDYIETSSELKAVFPHVRQSPRSQDAWTQTAITIDRPPTIRDPSLIAIGVGGAIAGARLNFILIDDILDMENTATKEQRDKVYEYVQSTVMSRLDPRGARLVVTNTAWHPEDLPHRLEMLGKPTLRMSITGDIKVTGEVNPNWAVDDEIAKELRPKTDSPYEIVCRLTANDPDPKNEQTLWPGRIDRTEMEKIRKATLPHRFKQLYEQECRDDGTSKCKIEYIEACKGTAKRLGITSLYREWKGEGQLTAFTGVDLAVRQGEGNDETAFFTFYVRPEDGVRVILDIEVGRFSGPQIVDKMFEKQRLFNSMIRVENNACFTPDTLVLTEGGYKAISEINIGDMVWTHEKRWRPVTNVIRGTSRTIHHVNVTGCVSVNATPNHWFRMREVGRTPGRNGGHHRPVGDAMWVSVAFPEKPAYVETAVPVWKSIPAVFAESPVTHEIAFMLGLYLAEGHSTGSQVFFTFGRDEGHLADAVERAIRSMEPGIRIRRTWGRGTLRIVCNSTRLARAFSVFGKSCSKTLPMSTLGWSKVIREHVVRGWLAGDGCLRTNNAQTEWPKKFFSGCSISRNWMLWVRTSLFDLGYRPTLALSSHRSESVIEGRTVRRSPIYTLSLNAEDSFALRIRMDHDAEAVHWPHIEDSMRRSNSQIVIDDDGVWSRLNQSDDYLVDAYNGPVFNLEVEEDHSFVVEDMVVHNAQDFVRQFALQRNMSLPVDGYQTGRAKADPTFGVEGIFVELANGAWAFPTDRYGHVDPRVQRVIDACLYYNPEKHTDDVLMALWLATTKAREWGMMSTFGPQPTNNQSGGSLGLSIMQR